MARSRSGNPDGRGGTSRRGEEGAGTRISRIATAPWTGRIEDSAKNQSDKGGVSDKHYADREDQPFTPSDVPIEKEEPGATAYPPTPKASYGCSKSDTAKLRQNKPKAGSASDAKRKTRRSVRYKKGGADGGEKSPRRGGTSLTSELPICERKKGRKVIAQRTSVGALPRDWRLVGRMV